LKQYYQSQKMQLARISAPNRSKTAASNGVTLSTNANARNYGNSGKLSTIATRFYNVRFLGHPFS